MFVNGKIWQYKYWSGAEFMGSLIAQSYNPNFISIKIYNQPIKIHGYVVYDINSKTVFLSSPSVAFPSSRPCIYNGWWKEAIQCPIGACTMYSINRLDWFQSSYWIQVQSSGLFYSFFPYKQHLDVINKTIFGLYVHAVAFL